MRLFAITILTALLLTGCATTQQEDPSQKAAEQAWISSLLKSKDSYGAYPNDYQNIVKSYMSQQLKDPDSAKYLNFREPKKYLKIVNVKNRVAILGYSTCVDINAKNSYGGYTGSKRYWFFIRDGNIVDSLNPEAQDQSPTLKNAMTQLIDITCQMPEMQ